MTIICISGKANAGKDTSAGYLKQTLERRGHTAHIVHYGDLTKFIAEKYFDWSGRKDEPGRSLLQYVGTEVVRTADPDYWVRFVTDTIRRFCKDRWEYVLIPDCRFPNEIECWNIEGFRHFHMRVHRPGLQTPLNTAQQSHASETALDDCKADWIVVNEEQDFEGLRRRIGGVADIITKEDNRLD